MKIGMLFGIFFIIFFATSIDSYNQTFLGEKGVSELDRDVFYKTLGGFKNFLSDVSYVNADMYYHGGIYKFTSDEECPHECLVEEKESAHKHAHEYVHEHEHAIQEIKPSLNILLDIGKATSITEHRHLSGKEDKEIVPWIYYAVKLNPHHIKAYSIGGFWLAAKLDKPDAAIKFLKEGLIKNPNSWEICETLGQIYFFNIKNYENAKTYLEKAKEFGNKQKVDKFEKRCIYTLLAETYEKTGNINKATELRRYLLELFPE